MPTISSRILIVDDSELNRAMLSEFLTGYEIIESKNGEEAVAMIERYGTSISLILLDLVMPIMNGFDVLDYMKKYHWIDTIPVIVISTENSPASIVAAFDHGITDFIKRPFVATVVRQRALNAIRLYTRQRNLSYAIAEQYRRNERSSQLMAHILSHIVEFRNGESSLHVLHISVLTNILLHTLIKTSNKYKLTPEDIILINHASSLHDIGKISVPDEILNKPGPLSKEEFEVIKMHTTNGAKMLQNLPWGQDTAFVRYAYEICRWHHERWDGSGYPDGLKQDEIPIAAQVVAIADVYDALTSKRVYKPPFSHERSIELMVSAGNFNPILIDCLQKAADEIKETIDHMTAQTFVNEQTTQIQKQLSKNQDIPITARLSGQPDANKQKLDFLLAQTNEMFFEYIPVPSSLFFFGGSTRLLGIEHKYSTPEKNTTLIEKIGQQNITKFTSLLRHTSSNNPTFHFKCRLTVNGKKVQKHVHCLTEWNALDDSILMNVFGQITD